MGLTVKCGEPAHHFFCEFDLPAHEHPLPGHEHLVKDERWTVLAVPNIAAIKPLDFTSIQGIPSDNVNKSLRIGRNSKSQRVILAPFLYGPGGKHNYLVGAQGPCLMNLGPSYDDPFFCLVYQSKVHVLIVL